MKKITRLEGKSINLSYPLRGQANNDQGRRIKLGKTVPSGQDFFISQKERSLHTHIIGATGKGKSKFLEILIRNDIENGQAGLCVIDPTGSLYADILNYAALHCRRIADRFILLDFSGENDFVAGFNPIRENAALAYDRPMIMNAIQKAWKQKDPNETPRLNRWLSNILSLIILNNLTLLEALLITNTREEGSAFRKALLKNCTDRDVREDWEEFETYNQTRKTEIIESTTNRLAKFFSAQPIRHTLGQQTHVLDFKKILDNKKILLVNLHAGVAAHDDYTNLIGILLIHEIVRAAKLRREHDPSVKPFYLYIDEFGQLITLDVARALDEVRKRKLFFILAHQHLSQLDDEKTPTLKYSALTNCRVKVAFGELNAEDAHYMADQLWGAYYDFDTPKDEIWGDEYEPVLKQVDVTSTTRGTSDDTSSSQSVSHGKKQENGTTRDTDAYGFFDDGRTISRTSGNNEARTQMSSSSHGTSFSETSSKQFVTDHIKHRVLRSRTFSSPEELKQKKAGILMNLPDQHAAIKIKNSEPVQIRVSNVTSSRITDFTKPFLEDFKQLSFRNNQDCYVPIENIDRDFLERDRKVQELLDALQTHPKPLLDEPEDPNPKPQKRKPPKRPKAPGDDSPFEC